jgi:ribosomal protein L11 methyltransferase
MRELAVRVPTDAAEAVLDRLLLLAPHGVHEVARGDEVELRLRGDVDALPSRAVAAAADEWAASLREREVPDDWRERRAADHEPLVVAGRIAVRPAWAPPPAEDLLDVTLEDHEAFGAGTHPTTRACLEALCALAPAGAFADLGCGTGVLAIAAARLGWGPITAVDREPHAAAAARANAARNGVAVDVRQADLATEPAPPASAIAANVPLEVHGAIAARLTEVPETLIASGLLAEHVDDALRAYAACGLREERRTLDAGWAVLVLGRA